MSSLLGQAHALGHLDRAELDVRSGRALTAVTVGDLDDLTADLPVAELRRRDPAARAARERAARRGVRAHVAAYGAGTVLMVTIWLLVGLTTGAWYPWPVWPVLGWGIGVLGHVLPVRRALRTGDLVERPAPGPVGWIPPFPDARRC